jgi:hypothetical protein
VISNGIDYLLFQECVGARSRLAHLRFEGAADSYPYHFGGMEESGPAADESAMEIGKPERITVVEPIEDPVPREVPAEEPAESPEREEVPA